MDEQPLVRNRSRRRSSASATHTEVEESEVNPTLNPPQPTVASETHPNGNAFPSDEVILSLHTLQCVFHEYNYSRKLEIGDIDLTFFFHMKFVEVQSCFPPHELLNPFL